MLNRNEHKEKLLEYLESEYESIFARNEAITSRAGITVTILSGAAVVLLDNHTVTTKTISIFQHNVAVKTILSVTFLLSLLPLLYLLFFRKNIFCISLEGLYKELYEEHDPRLPDDCTQLYTGLLCSICEKNNRQLNQRAMIYNISIFLLFIFVILYIYFCI